MACGLTLIIGHVQYIYIIIKFSNLVEFLWDSCVNCVGMIDVWQVEINCLWLLCKLYELIRPIVRKIFVIDFQLEWNYNQIWNL